MSADLGASFVFCDSFCFRPDSPFLILLRTDINTIAVMLLLNTTIITVIPVVVIMVTITPGNESFELNRDDALQLIGPMRSALGVPV